MMFLNKIIERVMTIKDTSHNYNVQFDEEVANTDINKPFRI